MYPYIALGTYKLFVYFVGRWTLLNTVTAWGIDVSTRG